MSGGLLLDFDVHPIQAAARVDAAEFGVFGETKFTKHDVPESDVCANHCELVLRVEVQMLVLRVAEILHARRSLVVAEMLRVHQRSLEIGERKPANAARFECPIQLREKQE
jgi:hypothetical protein